MPVKRLEQPWLDEPAAVAARLRRALRAPLPGLAAQTIMAPRPRAGWRPTYVPPDARQAAALAFLYPAAGDRGVSVALTVRAPGLLRHGGQVSLPGGAVEPGESAAEAAMREAHEEIGLTPFDVTVLGALTPLHIPVSGFVLSPIVGVGHQRPAFRLDSREVARLLEAPLAVLADPATVRLRWRAHQGRDYEVPYFALEGEQVWGATAMILSELLVMLGISTHPPVTAEAPSAGDPPE